MACLYLDEPNREVGISNDQVGQLTLMGRSGCLACLEQASFSRKPVQVSASKYRYLTKLIGLNGTWTAKESY